MEQQLVSKKEKKKKWYKIALKAFLWTIGSFIFLILLAWLLVVVFQDKIEQKVIERVNKEINSEIKVKDIDVSLFHNFPYVSVVFNDVSASDATLQKAGNLFSAKWVSLEFNLIDLITGDYTIRQIGMSGGYVWLKVFEDGSDNFHILKSKTDTSKSKESSEFHLQKVYIQDIQGGYLNEQHNQQYVFYFHKAKASGKFYENDYNIKLSAALRVDSIHVSGIDFIPGTEAVLNGVIDINNSLKSVSFNNVKIGIADVVLFAAGKVNYDENIQNVDISVKSDKTKLNEFISLLPEQFRKFFDEFKHKGLISIETNVKGNYGGGKMPGVNVFVNMQNGYIERKENKLALSNISFEGKLTTSDFANYENYFISLNNFKASLDGKAVSGKMQIQNLNKPNITMTLKGEVSLDKIQEWGRWNNIKEMSGNMKFDVQFDGVVNSFSKLNAKDFINSKCRGSLVIEKANLQTAEMSKPAFISKIDANFSNRDLEINDMQIVYGVSDFDGSAVLLDILPFLFTDDANLNLRAKLHSKNVDIVQLFPEENSVKKSKEIKFVLPKNVRAVINYSADRLSYNKFGASNAKAIVNISENKVLAENISLKTLGGKINGSGSCVLNNKNVKISLDADLKNIDVRETFFVFNNFGQENMTYDNLRGRTDVSLQMKADFSETLEVDPASIVANANIEIRDGQLVGYAPINNLEKILKGRDMSDIQFEKLVSSISIADKVINIPKTEIRSNVMNLKASGTHTFDNNIDYHLEVKFSDIKKAKNNNRAEDEYGYVVDDGVGDPTIFILITGTVDNPQYKQLDKKAMQEKIKQDLKNEKQNLKQILNEEFGLFKKDSTIKKVKTDTQTNNTFQIEWDDE
jgi:hypothetical protein